MQNKYLQNHDTQNRKELPKTVRMQILNKGYNRGYNREMADTTGRIAKIDKLNNG